MDSETRVDPGALTPAQEARHRTAAFLGWLYLDAEEALIASCLIDPTIFPDARALVRPGDFWRDKNRWVWDAMGRVHDQGKPIDQLNVYYSLHLMGKLEAANRHYLSALIANMPTSVYWRSYVDLMQDMARERNGETKRQTRPRGIAL